MSRNKSFIVSVLFFISTAGVSAAQEIDTMVNQFIAANKVWLQPDWELRKGLVYDYTQEHGHLQQVAFDQHGNCLVVYESPTVFPDREESIAAAEKHDKPFTMFLAEKNSVVYGNENSTFLRVATARPTQLFRGESGRADLATGWHWQGATRFLGLFPDEFDKELAESEDGKHILLTLKPKSRDATLEIGTMLSGFSSYAYLPNRRYERCEVLIDKSTNKPVEEHYYREDEQIAFSVIRYSDWFDIAGGQVPGKIKAEQTMGKNKSFSVVTTFRNDNGRWLAEKIESKFHETGEPDTGSTGIITVVNDETEIAQRLKKVVAVMKKIDDTKAFLDAVAEYPIERIKTVPFRLDIPVDVKFVGVMPHDEGEIEPWQHRIGIVEYTAKESDGKIIIEADVFSTCFGYQFILGSDYSITLHCSLLDTTGKVLADIEKRDSIRAEGIPASKTVMVEFDNVDSQSIRSIQFDFRIAGPVGTNFRGRWMYMYR